MLSAVSLCKANVSEKLRAYFIVRSYLKEAEAIVKTLQGLNYEADSARQNIRDISINPEYPMDPWVEVNHCTDNLRKCISELNVDIDAHERAIENRGFFEKVGDGISDVWKGTMAKLSAIKNKDFDEKAREMADITHTGTGKSTFVKSKGSTLEYRNLVERDQLWVGRIEVLMKKYGFKSD